MSAVLKTQCFNIKCGGLQLLQANGIHVAAQSLDAAEVASWCKYRRNPDFLIPSSEERIEPNVMLSSNLLPCK